MLCVACVVGVCIVCVRFECVWLSPLSDLPLSSGQATNPALPYLSVYPLPPSTPSASFGAQLRTAAAGLAAAAHPVLAKALFAGGTYGLSPVYNALVCTDIITRLCVYCVRSCLSVVCTNGSRACVCILSLMCVFVCVVWCVCVLRACVYTCSSC